MNPCSLPGMTQGARKRAARRDAVTAEKSGIYTDKGAKCPALLRRYMLAVFSANADDKETKRRYDEARARYRIGERLRPCRGCPDCNQEMRPWPRSSRIVNPPTCDGSGVLPAKRRRR